MENSWLTPRGHPTFKAIDPSPRVALPPSTSPSKLRDFSCKQFTAIWLGVEGDPPARDDFSLLPYIFTWFFPI